MSRLRACVSGLRWAFLLAWAVGVCLGEHRMEDVIVIGVAAIILGQIASEKGQQP